MSNDKIMKILTSSTNIGYSVSTFTINSTEYDKYNTFLKEVLQRCYNPTQPYDKKTKLPLTYTELEKFCSSAAELGLPLVYITERYYAVYSSFDELNKYEQRR